MNDNFENNDDCSTAAEECERFDIIENDILNNIGNQSVSDEKKRRIPAAAIFLAAGLGFDMWAKCWVVFPIGGILCGIAVLIIQGTTKDD